ncbi:putative intracellular protease/amidase [Nocardioides luteus]|uniref:Dimethylallyltransferase n=1 Tax=Nocardioides luteus TaxID=1844 RepID=A0ABQ5T476_9ACTN|nr:type 1 glutamine amidotransferase domain-containing protein [Nocardioides luteus]MDR7310275.1 putative intracellular protease/amidase [Nocardioides luteus]GGR53766.1 dimethylallyltransferase [Nocardioides luteus]GLJ69946.1 dimethylallyltransferase [Nocardioides luteus]
MTRVLMVVSAADKLVLADGSEHPTGYWAEEVAASHETLTAAGVDVDIATPGGRTPTVDDLSLSDKGGVDPEDADRFRAYLATLEAELGKPLSLDDVDPSAYDAVYIPGGHAPMADLVDDPELAAIVSATDSAGRPVVALCHGVAGLLGAKGEDGWLFGGRRMTGFTDTEEQQGGYGDAIPYSVEQRMREAGGVIETGEPWSDTVVVDGTLITGQNPQSSVSTAKALLARLG